MLNKELNVIDNLLKTFSEKDDLNSHHIDNLLNYLSQKNESLKQETLYNLYKLWFLNGRYNQLDDIMKIGKMNDNSLRVYYDLVFSHQKCANFIPTEIFKVGRPNDCLYIGRPLFKSAKKIEIHNLLIIWLSTFRPTSDEFDIIMNEAMRKNICNESKFYYSLDAHEIAILMSCAKFIQVEESKVEELKSEESKVEESKVEESKTEESKVEESKVEESKVEESKTEESKVEESKVEESKVEESKVEESKVEESKVEESKTEESKTEESKVEESKVEESKVEESKVEESKVDESKVEESKVEESKVEESKVEESKVEESQMSVVTAIETMKFDDVLDKIESGKFYFDLTDQVTKAFLEEDKEKAMKVLGKFINEHPSGIRYE